MRRFLFLRVMILLLIFFVNAAAEEWNSHVISGYSAGRFSIEGNVKLQVDDLKKEILRFKTDGNGKLVIKVTGMADSTGRSVDNDNLSLKRAEAVAAELGELKADFRQVEISAVPAGDSMNVRQVMVEYRFISAIVSPAAPVSADKHDERGKMPFLIFIFIVFFIAAVAMAVLRLTRRSAKKEDEGEKREIEVNGYVVPVWKKGDGWHSPFKTKTGLEIKRTGFDDIKKSVVGSMIKEEFASQKEELIRKGVVRKKEG